MWNNPNDRELEVRTDLKLLADEIAEKLGELYQLAGQVDQHDEGKAHIKSVCGRYRIRASKPRACETEPAQAEETKDT